jgi:hypothetical protein
MKGGREEGIGRKNIYKIRDADEARVWSQSVFALIRDKEVFNNFRIDKALNNPVKVGI